MRKYPNLAGQKFGKLTVVVEHGRNKQTNVMWECKCDCGKTTFVSTHALNSGNTKSCGCGKTECMLKVISQNPNNYFLSKDANGKKTRLYRIWAGMRTRCLNKNDKAYKNYGGRGIKICDEWLYFPNFYDWAQSNGYSEELTIERIDNDSGYNPSNCKWITLKRQANNRRSTKLFEHNGDLKTLSDWIAGTNIPYIIAWSRCKNGWNIGEVLEIGYIPHNNSPKAANLRRTKN